jgi:7,8-didemethyl-8-hydroxy-5-deazariboflavin synthase CofG subunit
MNVSKNLDKLKYLSLKKLKEEIRELKAELPREKQNIITYSKNITLSLSNYCQNRCKYCFYNHRIPKDSGEENVALIREEKINESIQIATKNKCREALLMSGEYPDTYNEVRSELERRNFEDFIHFVRNLSFRLLDANILPHTNIGLLTYEQLKSLKECNASMGLMIESTNKHLLKEGGVHHNSPGKIPENRIRHIKNAGRLKIPFTTGLLLGIGENFDDRIHDLLLIKEIHSEYGHIQEVIIQNFTDKEGIQYHPENPLTIEETLKTAGYAKLILGNDISIQVPPNLIQNHEKDAIELGIDDFGGISPYTLDYINPEHVWPKYEYLENICKKVGYQLAERLPIYEKYITKKGFCPENIKKTIDNINLNERNK